MSTNSNKKSVVRECHDNEVAPLTPAPPKALEGSTRSPQDKAEKDGGRRTESDVGVFQSTTTTWDRSSDALPWSPSTVDGSGLQHGDPSHVGDNARTGATTAITYGDHKIEAPDSDCGIVILSALASSAIGDEDDDDDEDENAANGNRSREDVSDPASTLEMYRTLAAQDDLSDSSDRHNSTSSACSTSGLPPPMPRRTDSSSFQSKTPLNERHQNDVVAAASDAAATPTLDWSGANGRPSPVPTVRLERQDAMSDLWQHQESYRTNRRSMKSMFDEFKQSLDLAARRGKRKAEIKDIFSFATVGFKHLVTQSQSEDRIAIQQVVVPSLDGQSVEDLGIECIDTTPFSLFGVFDGHGGAACAEFLKNSVSTVLARSPVLYDEDLAPFERRACATAYSFAELEKVHNDWARGNGDTSGSTAILSTFQDGVLVMAGVGDSAGLYVDHEGNQNMLCPQHSTSNPQEVKRIINMGGKIVNNRVAGCLEPTRTIGDVDCKEALGNIVSPHPEIKLAAIHAPPDDGEDHDEPFLILASDGLWNVLSTAEVAFLTHRGLRHLRAKASREAKKVERANAKLARQLKLKGKGKGKGKEKRKEKEKEEKEETEKSGTAMTNANLEKTRASAVGRRILSPFSRLQSPRRFTTPITVSSPERDGRDGLDDWTCSRGSGLLTKFFDTGMGSAASTPGGVSNGHFLDLSESIKGLDASVKGDRVIVSATLDQKQHAASTGMHLPPLTPRAAMTTGGGQNKDEGAAQTEAKAVALTSTSTSAGLWTSGTPNDNVAMHLVHAAIRANSTDDISVVVVTFKGGEDRAPPGFNTPGRKASEVT